MKCIVCGRTKKYFLEHNAQIKEIYISVLKNIDEELSHIRNDRIQTIGYSEENKNAVRLISNEVLTFNIDNT